MKNHLSEVKLKIKEYFGNLTKMFHENGFCFSSGNKEGPYGPSKEELLSFYENDWTKRSELFQVPKNGYQEGIPEKRANFRHEMRDKIETEGMAIYLSPILSPFLKIPEIYSKS